jgi:Zn-dependent peptidase ImmA (M78 family)
VRRRDVIAEARHDAHQFLRKYAARSRADILPEQWVEAEEVKLVEAPLDGASAQLIRIGKLAEIVLPETQTDRGARRFSMMHELYHFLKKHRSPTPTMMCQPKWARRADAGVRLPEVGANAFAGAVLLPEFLLRRRCEVSPVSLDVPFQIAKEYEVSILTAAIRFTELTSERCAAVFSRGGVVQWAARSQTFTRTITKGTRLSRESVAWDFFAKGKLDERAQPVSARAWFEAKRDGDIIEHSICSPEHRTVLSLLWVPEAVASEVGMV